MADIIKAKQKLEQLATKVKGSTTTFAEDQRIIRAVDAGKIKNRSDITRELSESLNKSPSDIGVALASDDSDRLADEIVSLLKE
jgi:hypothetical protein